MGTAATERELAERLARYLKAELKRSDVTYEKLATRLNLQGLDETKHSIAAKLRRGTFPATFFVSVMTALDIKAIRVEDL